MPIEIHNAGQLAPLLSNQPEGNINDNVDGYLFCGDQTLYYIVPDGQFLNFNYSENGLPPQNHIPIFVEPGVSIIVDGDLLTEECTFQRVQGQGAWGGVFARGQRVGNGNGRIKCENTTFEGGGADPTLEETEERDNGIDIVLPHLYQNQGSLLGTINQRYVPGGMGENWDPEPDDARPYRPIIHLNGCFLVNSENYGINTFDVFADDLSSVAPEITCKITDFTMMTNSGIRYAPLCDMHFPLDEDPYVLTIEDCEINDCGAGDMTGCGIEHESVDHRFDANITHNPQNQGETCSISNNANDGLKVFCSNSGIPNLTIDNVTLNNNGFLAEVGSGIDVRNTHQGGSLDVRNSSIVNNNYSSGIFCWFVKMIIEIDHCFVNQNGLNILEENGFLEGMGIRVHIHHPLYDAEGEPTTISNCEIRNNGFQGACISSIAPNATATLSNNMFYENAQAVDFNVMDANDFAEGAQIHLLMGLKKSNVVNNIIYSDGVDPYPATGICIDEHENDQLVWQRPGNLMITNNIQMNARYGLYIEVLAKVFLKNLAFGLD